MTVMEIATALHAVNLGRCKPPLEEREVEEIAASIGRYPVADRRAPRLRVRWVGSYGRA
jgi:hypothetical protein